MSHQIPWTKKLMEDFIDEGMLTEDEAFLLRSRVKGWTVTQQAMELHKSESTIHKMIRKIKVKYDRVQQESPDKYPIRFKSAQELYMDTH